MTAAALAYASTLAFAGWVLWLRDRKGPPITGIIADIDHRVKNLGTAFSELSVRESETRAIVDNLSLKSGLTPRR